MSLSVTMPQMGESVVEGTVERWRVAEGDRVEKDQVLCEVTTDKVDAEIPAPAAGVVSKILVPPGTTVRVGVEIATLEPSAGGAVAESAPAAKSPAKPAAEKAAAPAKPAAAKPAKPAAAAAKPAAKPEPVAKIEKGADARPPRSTPLARRIAEEKGLPLDEVAGSGVAGRVTKADVLGHSEERAPSAEPAAAAATGAPVVMAAPGTLGEFLAGMKVAQYAPREGDRVIPFTPIRRRIAEHMVVSKIVSPHVGTLAEADLLELVRRRDAIKGEFKRVHGYNLTYLPFLLQATVRGLQEFPRMNSAVVGQSIVERDGIHIGVAVETDRGLVVPVVRDADRLSVTGLAQAVEDLATRARERTLGPDDLQGGTFTVSNPGRHGNLYGFAVINQPQVGILRMGEVKKRAVVVERDGEDAIAIHPMMYLALSYDHRIIDGATGNNFLYAVTQHLQKADFEI
jgi:2-oxoglutarate dehydrogenase E2 component (dihydrolipoamide succinyltransferase)